MKKGRPFSLELLGQALWALVGMACTYPRVFFFFVISDWRPALNLAALDCAEETNSAVCRDFNIPGFPTVRVCDRERAMRA